MSREREKEKEKKNGEETSRGRDYSLRSKKGMGDRDSSSSNSGWVRPSRGSPENIRASGKNRKLHLNCDGCSSRVGRDGGSPSTESQDADYSYIPPLSDELGLLILARVPRSEYWKFCFLNKRYVSVLKSGELYKVRREIGFKEPSVFMLATGETSWWAFDRQFKSRRKLPILPADTCFISGDKESLCAGTDLMVSGNEIDGVVIWRYELTTNEWYRGPYMIDPRCLFASATNGTFAFVAGGLGMGSVKGVLNSAEKYNPDNKSWNPLPRMKKRRQFCSGFYMDNKFYVIGGRDEDRNELTCGEAFNEDKNTWEHIPDMLKGAPVTISRSPPLVAVVNNELYSLEASSNELKVYLKKSNTWKTLGTVPVKADLNRGWGVAFKSLGNELLVIGASSISNAGHGMTIYTCCPDPTADELHWRPLDNGRNRLSHFILNCSVMVA